MVAVRREEMCRVAVPWARSEAEHGVLRGRMYCEDEGSDCVLVSEDGGIVVMADDPEELSVSISEALGGAVLGRIYVLEPREKAERCRLPWR